MPKLPQKTLKELKEHLLLERKRIEQDLRSIASKDPSVADDWDTRFPHFDVNASLEEGADEVEEYATRLSIEHTLEARLQEIDMALGKIKEGPYGVCQTCNKPIDLKRLKIYPGANYCIRCKIKEI